MHVCLNHCCDYWPWHTHIHTTQTCMCAPNMFTHLSSKRLLSSSHFSRDAWRSFSSPSREVTWALRASLSLVSCKTKQTNLHQWTMHNCPRDAKSSVCVCIPEYNPSLSVWVEPLFYPSALCSVLVDSVFPEALDTYAKRTNKRLIHPNQHLSLRVPYQIVFLIFKQQIHML